MSGPIQSTASAVLIQRLQAILASDRPQLGSHSSLDTNLLSTLMTLSSNKTEQHTQGSEGQRIDTEAAAENAETRLLQVLHSTTEEVETFSFATPYMRCMTNVIESGPGVPARLWGRTCQVPIEYRTVRGCHLNNHELDTMEVCGLLRSAMGKGVEATRYQHSILEIGATSTTEFKEAMRTRVCQSTFGEKGLSTAVNLKDVSPLSRRSADDTVPCLFLGVLSAPNTTQGFLDHALSTNKHKPIGAITGGWSGRTLSRTLTREIYGLVEVGELSATSRGLFKAVNKDGSINDTKIGSVLRNGLTVIGKIIQSICIQTRLYKSICRSGQY